MIKWDEKYIAEMASVNDALNEGGGVERVRKLHDRGMMTARERMDLLLDSGYEEINKLAKPRTVFQEVPRKQYWGDGVIAAIGYIEGIRVCAVAQDSTISGGAGGEAHVNKICDALEKAIQLRCPIIYMCDSGGARIEEGIVSLASYSRLFRLNTRASGYIPQIALIMGNCAGGSSYSPALCDFILMVEGESQLFITGPKVIRALTGESITMSELGGVDVHSRYSGQVHLVCRDDAECINTAKKLLDYLTVSRVEKKATKRIDYSKRGAALMRIVPDNPRKPYDVRKVLESILDDSSLFELLPYYAANMVVGFARISGQTVGIVANQPAVLGGAIDCDASDKCARFVRTCDCFDIPILTFVDVPGFYPGLSEEKKGILRHGSKILYAYSEATVPKVTLIMRKAYGGAYCAMNSKALGADYVFAWPVCEIAVMGADGAVDVIYHKEIENSDFPDKVRADRVEQYEKIYLNPYYAASCGYVDEVINPEDTRDKLILILDLLSGKEDHYLKLSKKHGNIPL